MIVRHWLEKDIPAAFKLMRDLAVFENYLETFHGSEHILLEQGFKLNPPNFYCLVAELDQEIVGVLVYYFLPYTASGKPMLFIKELIVSESARGSGAGTALMKAAASEAKARGCAGMKWTVASWNEAGKTFYEKLGATNDPVWVEHYLTGDALEKLASEQS
jgi:GNAT superfamily N-acetyltransferase